MGLGRVIVRDDISEKVILNWDLEYEVGHINAERKENTPGKENSRITHQKKDLEDKEHDVRGCYS